MGEPARKQELLVQLSVDDLRDIVRSAVKQELDSRAEPSEVMTTDGAGELLQLDPKTVAKYASAGKVPAHRLGPEWRFRRSELLQWLAEQGR